MEKEETYHSLDLLFIAKRVWRKRLWVVLVTLLILILTVIGTVFFMKPEYQSTTKVYIISQKETTLTAGDLQLSNFLVKDYEEMILSNTVLNEVARQESISVSELKRKISIQSPKDTRVLSISVMDRNAQRASDIANKVRETASKKITEVTKIDDVTVLDEAVPAESPSSPNLRRNIVVAVLAGLFLSIGYFVIVELLDDKVKNEEDVESVLGLVLLGTVPQMDK